MAPFLKSSHKCGILTAWHWSHHRKIATSCTSEGSSRGASGRSASASSTDTGSEAELVDGLLFESISNRATFTRQNFQTQQANIALPLPRCFPRSLLLRYIHFISLSCVQANTRIFKLTTLCIDCNGEVLREWTPELKSRSWHTSGLILKLSILYVLYINNLSTFWYNAW